MLFVNKWQLLDLASIGFSKKCMKVENFEYVMLILYFLNFKMGIVEKIQEIEKEIARTQKNKATEYHLGILKAKLAKCRQQLLEPQGKSKEKGEGFDVMKSGDARVALIGFPSVGKSTILSLLTKTQSECADYEFTTLTCIPGVIEYHGANIQLLGKLLVVKLQRILLLSD